MREHRKPPRGGFGSLCTVANLGGGLVLGVSFDQNELHFVNVGPHRLFSIWARKRKHRRRKESATIALARTEHCDHRPEVLITSRAIAKSSHVAVCIVCADRGTGAGQEPRRRLGSSRGL